MSQVKERLFYDHQEKVAAINTALHNQSRDGHKLTLAIVWSTRTPLLRFKRNAYRTSITGRILDWLEVVFNYGMGMYCVYFIGAQAREENDQGRWWQPCAKSYYLPVCSIEGVPESLFVQSGDSR